MQLGAYSPRRRAGRRAAPPAPICMPCPAGRGAVHSNHLDAAPSKMHTMSRCRLESKTSCVFARYTHAVDTGMFRLGINQCHGACINASVQVLALTR